MTEYIKSVGASTTTGTTSTTKTGADFLKELADYIKSTGSTGTSSTDKTSDALIQQLSDYMKSSDTTKTDNAQSTDSFMQQYYMMQQLQPDSGVTNTDSANQDTLSALSQKYAAAITSYDNNSKFID